MTAGAVAVFVLGVIFALIGMVWAAERLARFIYSDSSDDEEERDICEGHHFEEASRKLIELKRPDKSFSIVLAKVYKKCQHQGCLEEYIDWEIDRFIVYGDSTSGGFYLGHNVREAVGKLTDGKLHEKYVRGVAAAASRPDRVCEVPIEERGSDEHEGD